MLVPRCLDIMMTKLVRTCIVLEIYSSLMYLSCLDFEDGPYHCSFLLAPV